MNRAQPQNIALSGIKIGDPNPPAPPLDGTVMDGDIIVDQLVDMNHPEGLRSDFQNCDLHGFSYYFFNGTCDLFNSDFRNNGGVDPMLGCGIYFQTTVGFYMAGQGRIRIDETNVHNNTWDGIRVDDGAALTTITNSEVFHNNYRGIYYDFMGGGIRDLVRIYYNHIWENDWEGVFAQKGWGLEGSIKVNRNFFEDNGLNIADFPGNAWQVACVRLHGNIGVDPEGAMGGEGERRSQVQNNRLEGAYSGVVIEHLNGNPADNPSAIEVRNNVQIGDPERPTWYGVYLQQSDNFPGDGVIIHNNIISDNFDFDEIDCAGIFIESRPDANPNRYNNNLFIDCEVGIQDQAAGDPVFDFCGFQNVGQRIVGGNEGMNMVVANPILVGGGDWHLQWNSPMINRGSAAVNHPWNGRIWEDPDGSRNDIGAYGGERADDFSWTGWEDYVAILANSHLTNDFLGSLRWDTYWMFGNCDVLQAQGQALDIDPGTTILMFPGVSFKEAGVTLRINGTGWGVGERVLIRARDELNEQQYMQANPHGGVHFNGGQGSISFLDIWGAGANNSYALDINSGADVEFSNNRCHHSYGGILVTGATPVDIDDSVIDFNQYWGIYLSNTGLNVGINRCQVNDNYERGIRASFGVREIVDTDVLRNGWQGIWLSNCEQGIEPAPALLQGVHSNDSDCGNRNLAAYGYYLFETDARFDEGFRDPEVENPKCEAQHNYSYGLCTSTGAEPIISQTDFLENGRADIGLRPEIQVAPSHRVFFDSDPEEPTVEISDTRAGGHFVLIRRATMVGGQIDGVGVRWHINGNEADNWQVCLPTNENDPDLRLLTAETIDNWVFLDNVREERLAWMVFKRARQLGSENANDEAFQALTSVIEDYPQTAVARLALSSLGIVWRRLDGAPEQLNRLLDGLEVPEDAIMLRDDIFYNRLYNLVRQSEYDRAIEGLAARMEDACDNLDSLRAATALEEVLLVRMFDEREGDLDAVGNIHEQQQRLSDVVDALIAAETSPEDKGRNKPMIPSQFEILSANPNPFNSAVNITFGIPEEGLVSVKIFDLGGREVVSLFEGQQEAGIHRQVWMADGAPSGIYICKSKQVERRSLQNYTWCGKCRSA